MMKLKMPQERWKDVLEDAGGEESLKDVLE